MSAHNDRFERALVRPAVGRFDESDLVGLPDPVVRYFDASIALGTPLAQTARIGMRGRIKLNRWVAFHGTEVITPSVGFIWAVRAGVISGFDRYLDGQGEMRWRLLGLVPVMRASGPDIARSTGARVAGEGIWIPTALLPRFGTRWVAVDDTHIESHHTIDGFDVTCHHTLDGTGRITTTRIDRWGDPDRTGTFALHPFGVETTAFATFGGLTIPAAGRAGWHHGTDRWAEGIFFEYQLTSLDPVAAAHHTSAADASE